MRQWNVDPTKLCRQHLLGEHNEMHTFVGTINRWRAGGKGAMKDFPNSRFVTEGLVEVHTIRARHDELASELERRGLKHNSPLIEFKEFVAGKIDVKANEVELGRRCTQCQFENDGLPSSSPRKQNVHKPVSIKR